MTKGDSSNFYLAFQATSNTNTGLLFANLYFDLNPVSGADLGFEIMNDLAFIPGVAGSTSTIGSGIQYASVDGDGSATPAVIEVAIPWTLFTCDSLAMGDTPSTTAVSLRLSQTLGYSVAGGASYGNDRLGTLAVTTRLYLKRVV